MEMIDLGSKVEEKLQNSQTQRLNLMDLLKKAIEKEGPINLEIKYQLNNIEFVEE